MGKFWNMKWMEKEIVEGFTQKFTNTIHTIGSRLSPQSRFQQQFPAIFVFFVCSHVEIREKFSSHFIARVKLNFLCIHDCLCCCILHDVDGERKKMWKVESVNERRKRENEKQKIMNNYALGISELQEWVATLWWTRFEGNQWNSFYILHEKF